MSAVAAKVLDDAADLIETQGWAKNVFGNDETGYCIAGAIIKVTSSNAAAAKAINVVCDLLVERGLGGILSSYNDFVANSAAEVIELLHAAALNERGAELEEETFY